MGESFENFSGQQEPTIEKSRPVEKREKEKTPSELARSLLANGISEKLKPNGFKKEGNSLWVCHTGGFVEIVYLQRSSWSLAYYIEMGICPEEEIFIGDKPDVVDCDIRERVDNNPMEIVLPSDGDRSCVEKSIEEQTAAIIKEFGEVVLPWFENNLPKTKPDILFKQAQVDVVALEVVNRFKIRFDPDSKTLKDIYEAAIEDFCAYNGLKIENTDERSFEIFTKRNLQKMQKLLPQIHLRARAAFRLQNKSQRN